MLYWAVVWILARLLPTPDSRTNSFSSLCSRYIVDRYIGCQPTEQRAKNPVTSVKVQPVFFFGKVKDPILETYLARDFFINFLLLLLFSSPSCFSSILVIFYSFLINIRLYDTFCNVSSFFKVTFLIMFN